MKDFKSHFEFNKRERSGIFFLLLLIIVLQLVYFILKWNVVGTDASKFNIDAATQSKIDSLKAIEISKNTVKLFPFNPNFITDYKGYTLGMSSEEIDRLHQFRSEDKYVNSVNEFQQVTKVSDSLLTKISPYFKFPDWVKNNNKNNKATSRKNPVNEVQDLNTASADDLKKIRGIGDKLSARIIKFRDRLGGFLVNEQLYDVYGLEPQVVERTLQSYQVLEQPTIKRININTASKEELASLIYIRRDLAEQIVNNRLIQGGFGSLDELAHVEGFPKEKIERIKLYLSL